jgi:3-hydroxyisobutyrate dehydrogenase-like beta-hydroxyacid dehydrogenase
MRCIFLLGAWDGTLSVMVGCEENVFPKILPILKLFSAKQIRFGDTGKQTISPAW